MEQNTQTDTDPDHLNGYRNYDDTRTDKRSYHTKQILAELIQPGGRTIYYEILELINSIWNREEKPQCQKQSISITI